MTRKQLKFWVFLVMSLYLLSVVIGIFLRPPFVKDPSGLYETYKDLIPFLLAAPTAWLGYCFSRRLTYISQLKALWADLNSSIQEAIQYTHKENPTTEDFSSVMRSIGFSIDEVRASFKNLGEGRSNKGLYPFEDLKDIHKIVSSLGHGEGFRYAERHEAREEILKRWGNIRLPLLSEFERQEPTNPSSPFWRK
ncbi:hypothetical protein E2974_05630 [Paracoccus yeei]|uniref:hypothetical protein n=1 Tax=Paracoccus yeei TaxID=147645 RepID=UPI003BF8B1C2